jgi:hypothetical protein
MDKRNTCCLLNVSSDPLSQWLPIDQNQFSVADNQVILIGFMLVNNL